MTDYSDLVVRAQGLAGHLLRPAQFVPLCSCSAAQLATQLAALGAIAADAASSETHGPPDGQRLERALRERAAQRLQILARWSGNRYAALAVLFEDEDMRSLRTLVRRITSNIAPGDRTAGLIPTPSLPMRALNALASSGDVANAASLLLAWQNPYGSSMALEAARPRPELLRYDVALARVFADRARTSSRHNGVLRHYAELVIDFANLWTALVLADHRTDVDVALLYVNGGTLIQQADLALAVSAARREPLVMQLRPRVAGTPIGAALDATVERSAEDAALDAMVAEFRLLARRDPTSLAPVIAFVLQQRAELRALLRIVWSVALGVPAATIQRAVGVAA